MVLVNLICNWFGAVHDCYFPHSKIGYKIHTFNFNVSLEILYEYDEEEYFMENGKCTPLQRASSVIVPSLRNRDSFSINSAELSEKILCSLSSKSV